MPNFLMEIEEQRVGVIEVQAVDEGSAHDAIEKAIELGALGVASFACIERSICVADEDVFRQVPCSNLDEIPEPAEFISREIKNFLMETTDSKAYCGRLSPEAVADAAKQGIEIFLSQLQSSRPLQTM